MTDFFIGLTHMFGQACLGFVVGVAAFELKLFPGDLKANGVVCGMAGTLGALLGTSFLKRTRYEDSHTAHWIAAVAGSVGIFVLYFIVDHWG
ncbi:MAG: hypothetical protein K1X36_11690 [Pyrinomonadaceae bacterium]|nr:hypothetical protein [Pyrinomonadaceae bacterium]